MAAAALTALLLSMPMPASADMESAFWARNWNEMDEIYSSAASPDASGNPPAPLSAREESIYVNGLWLQGRYEEGSAILERIQHDLPDDLRAYADMLVILGAERTGRKDEAFERGTAAWGANTPPSLRYYLAYAMARLASDLSKQEEALVWLRRMYELAPDKKRAREALSRLMELGGASDDEAAALLIDSPADQRALAMLSKGASGASSLVEYALGHVAYIGKQYSRAGAHFELASRDIEYGEAARYYQAYSAFREKKNDLAYSIWSDIALTGFDYPQRSVQRLLNFAERVKKSDLIKLLDKIADAREKDYPEVAADALAGIIKLGDQSEASLAEKKLFESHAATTQAASIRWERGWKFWKGKNYKAAYEQWASGYSPLLKNSELASRLLYWQSRALEQLNSPVAAGRVKDKLAESWPAEYHTFLANPDGGIKADPIPQSYVASSDLLEWGFVTYARLEGAGISAEDATSADIPALFRATRIALWEEDFSAASRTFSVLRKVIPPGELASAELLKMSYPRAYERPVMEASKKTGVAPEIIWGVMRQESLYQPDVTSSAGAYGLMQLMPATARGEAKKMAMSEDAYLRPQDNIMLGANHLAGLFARFKEPPLSLAAYNAGGSPVSRWSKAPIADMAEWIEDIAYRETRGYVKAVLRNIEAYRLLYPSEPGEGGTR
ncbi:MAG: lytic transglycosylase domain-containing protein [Synergistaceae bacterium]|nr:lytic transglycosylase domain-containing protein [Synergistaceae bacterium]